MEGDLFVLQTVEGINQNWNVLGRVTFTWNINGYDVPAFYEGDVHLPGYSTASDVASDSDNDASGSDDDAHSDRVVPSGKQSSTFSGTIAGSVDGERVSDEVVQFSGAGSLCVGV